MKKAIQIFEYDTLRVNETYNGVTFLSRHFDSLMKWNEKQKIKYFSSGHKSLTFKNYVGVIHVKGLVIEILPKADKKDNSDIALWKQSLMYMLSVVNDLKNMYISTPALLKKTRNISLMDFFIKIFIKETLEVVHSGLVKNYRQVDKNSFIIKGKILFQENLKKNLFNKEKCFIRTTTYDYQNVFNAILKTAIVILRSTYFLNNSINRELANLDINFENIKPISLMNIHWERLSYNRKNDHYKKALSIARLIIENCNPDLQAGKNNILAFLFDMNKLFESFITKVCKRASKDKDVKDLTVYSQQSKKFWGNQYIRPDIIFQFDKKNIVAVADTKWKLNQNKPSSEDLKQMFVYNIYWHSCMSYLIYPQMDSNDRTIFNSFFEQTELLKDFHHSVAILPINIFKENKLNKNIGKNIIDIIQEKEALRTKLK